MSSNTPDLGQLLSEVADFATGRMHTAIPATVLVYDSVRQTVTAKPTISGRYHDPATGILVPFPFPAVANVPVAFPSSGTFSIHWPIAPGDTVLLVIADRSLDEFKSTGAAECIPQDIRRFDLTDSIAIPGVRPFTSPIPPTGISPTAMVLAAPELLLGSSAAVDFVALASLVLTQLNAIITTFNVHVHGGSGTPATVLMTPAGSVASTTVRSL